MATPKIAKPRRTFIRKKTATEPEKKEVQVEKPIKEEEEIVEEVKNVEGPTKESTPEVATDTDKATEDETSEPTVTVNEKADISIEVETTTTPATDTVEEESTVTIEDTVTETVETPTETNTATSFQQDSMPDTSTSEPVITEEKPNTPFFTSSVSVEKPDPKRLIWILGPILAIVLLFIGGYFINSMSKKAPEEKKAIVATEPTDAPTPTPEEVNLAEYEIKVLNGHGAAGAASKASDLLDDAGFNVGDLGNAGKTDYTETIIQAKEEVSKAYLTKLEDTLKETYVVGDAEELDADEDVDVIIILGNKTVE